MTRWSNWSGSVQCEPRHVHRPVDLDALRRIVADVHRRGGELRVAGSGHSFSPLVATPDTLVSLEHLQGIVSINPELQRATVWAGTKISDLGEPLLEHGLALLNQGDIHEQAIAGAVSTGTHGTGVDLGSLSTQVTAMTLVTAEGDLLELDADSDPEILRMARVSLGSLGVLARLELQLRPAYKLHERKTNQSLEDCLSTIDDAKTSARHWEFFWFPHSARVGIKVLDETDAQPRWSRLKYLVSDLVLENAGWYLLCQVARTFPKSAPAVARFAAANLGQGERIHWSHRIFPNPRLVRFNEMEYAVPAERGPDCLRELAAFVRDERIAVHFPVEYRYVAADDIPLSPFHRRDCAVLSVHMYRGMPHETYFRGAEAIFRRHGGRPHWGKMHHLGATDFAELYPEWDAFQDLRRRMDPGGLFMNDHLRHIFGG